MDAGFRRVGESGLLVSVPGLGCNNFGLKLDAGQSRVVVDAALDAGITLFDTADSYGPSEERLGAALKGRRDDVIIATKFGADVRQSGLENGLPFRGTDNGVDWGSRASRRYVRRAVETSLQRLQTEWIDLYQLHRPDPLTPIEETLSVLDDLVHEGKVRYIGSSNFDGWQVADAAWVARTRGITHFISVQNEYSLLRRDIEIHVVPAIMKYGIGLLPYFPLASGLLTGKYRRGEAPPVGSRLDVWGRAAMLENERDLDIVDELSTLADEVGVSLLAIALGGLAAQPGVSSVIAGATSAEQVRANAAACAWLPDVEVLARINAITRGEGGGSHAD